MAMNPHLKSYGLLAASIAGAAILSFFCGWLIVGTAPGADQAQAIDYGLTMGLVISPLFGFLFWAMTFEPPVVPPAKTVGWRRWRFLIWWVGLSAFLMAVLAIRDAGAINTLNSIAGVSIPFALVLSFMGWVFLSARSDRARTLDMQRRRKAFAGRLTEAILEVAKSDPYLGLEEIKAFLSKPYNAMNWLSEHGWVRPVDLHYFSGVADATVLPETVTLIAEGSAETKDVPVLTEYALFIEALAALTTDDWTDAKIEGLTAHIEMRAEELRKARLAKKL